VLLRAIGKLGDAKAVKPIVEYIKLTHKNKDEFKHDVIFFASLSEETMNALTSIGRPALKPLKESLYGERNDAVHKSIQKAIKKLESIKQEP